ncbi:hypothetical protein FLONG3_9513 [Fusarium longipes]|uniref:Uncharacterized protein n=1 Tax=Fusarium longipes TaxID=694270 RepID=A0A395RWH8_9HYPO|nr:hypothetical protein FLONG3_9513 [Fusarium longipes]
MDYRCASLSVKDVQSVDYTFYGRKNPKFTTRTANGLGAAEITRDAALATSSSEFKEEKKSSTPLGAIIGGAVGGVARIGIIMLGIFFMLRQKKIKTAPTEGPINPPTMNFAPQHFPQNTEPGMLDSKEVGTHHVGSAVSPLGSSGWGGSVSPPPVYEAPAQEAQVHEMGDSSVTK